LQNDGWVPTSASQVNSRTARANSTAKHLIRLRRSDAIDQQSIVGDSISEIVLFNSHNGKSHFDLRMGRYRFVCANGMVVGDEEFGAIKIRHIGYSDEQVLEASQTFLENCGRVEEVVRDWQDVSLDRDQVRSFGIEAAKLRFSEPDNIVANELLRVRRTEDSKNDLWSVFNRVQENILEGGFLIPGGRRRSRKITSLDKNIDINTKLWDLASSYSLN